MSHNKCTLIARISCHTEFLGKTVSTNELFFFENKKIYERNGIIQIN